MSDNTNVEPEPSSWLTIIPDFFYEVIGRIIPGSTFILGLTYTINQTFLFDLIFKKKIAGEPVDPSYALIFILLLGFSYSLGYFLTPFGDFLGNSSYLKGKWQYKKKLKECSIASKNHYQWLLERDKSENVVLEVDILSHEQIDSIFQCQHDQVRYNCPNLIRSLSKSQADVQLCINTSAAFLLVFFVSIIIDFVIPSIKAYFQIIICLAPVVNVCFQKIIGLAAKWFVFILVAGGFWWAASYRNKRFLERQFSFSKIAQDEYEKKQTVKMWIKNRRLKSA